VASKTTKVAGAVWAWNAHKPPMPSIEIDTNPANLSFATIDSFILLYGFGPTRFPDVAPFGSGGAETKAKTPENKTLCFGCLDAVM
jgi:hypothetical protein